MRRSRAIAGTGVAGNPDFERRYAELGLPEAHDEIASLVTIRDGKVVQMRDYLTKAEALAAVSEESDGA